MTDEELANEIESIELEESFEELLSLEDQAKFDEYINPLKVDSQVPEDMYFQKIGNRF